MDDTGTVMQNQIKQYLTLFAAGLFLWLIWGFWSLGQAITIFLTVLTVLMTSGIVFWRFKQQQRTLAVEKTIVDKLPAADYQGAVVLVCGQSQCLFPQGEAYRETSQGWYLCASNPTELVNIVQHVAEQAPAQLGQLSLLFTVIPEQITQQEGLTQEILSWRRAIAESRQKAGKRLPFWISVYLNPLANLDASLDTPWFTLLSHQGEFQVVQESIIAEPFSVWLPANSPDIEHQLQTTLWFDELLAWLQDIFIPQLTVAQTGAPALTATAWAVQLIGIDSQPNNIWQQYIQRKTTLLPINSSQSVDLLPLPDVLLGRLRHDVNLLRSERFIGVMGLICGLFLIGALVGSYQNNRQLIRNIGEDVSRFHQFSDETIEPKMVAYQQLQLDAAQLANWQREGVPAAYSLALYQGDTLLPYLHMLLSSWAPPKALAPIIVQASPDIISLDSLALFDVGQYELKANATKVLVDALMNIRAKPDWLIVISGYTDNTGNPQLNQKLSLKRAESVRDWMINTSDINPTCFAVQGYGQNHPIADNDTPEGRASNRRVEIRLIPQANACQVSNTKSVSSMEDGTPSNEKEK